MREAAGELDLDGDVTYELMLATTEAFANAVEHGAPCADGGIFVRVESHDGGVGVEVCDCGGCFSRNGATTRKRDGVGGRGIPIIEAIMDTLEVLPHPGTTRVRFEKWLSTA